MVLFLKVILGIVGCVLDIFEALACTRHDDRPDRWLLLDGYIHEAMNEAKCRELSFNALSVSYLETLAKPLGKL